MSIILTPANLKPANNSDSERDASSVAFKRVRYISIPAPDSRVLVQFADPFNCLAIQEDIDNLKVGDWPSSPSAENPSGPDFECALLLPGKVPSALKSRASAWLDALDTGADTARIRLNETGSSWVWAKPGRVVLCCESADVPGLLCALSDFFLYENELSKLENEIKGQWPQVEKDLPLATDVKSADLQRQPELGASTCAVWQRRIRLARLERPLARSPLVLQNTSRKLAAKLRSSFDVDDRAEVLDGQIEVYEYIYEMANQRMGEFSNFRKEYLLEIVIVVLLSTEVALMIVDAIRTFFDL